MLDVGAGRGGDLSKWRAGVRGCGRTARWGGVAYHETPSFFIRALVASKAVSLSSCVHACAGYHGERRCWSCV